MASLDGRTLFVDPENPENDLKIISIDPELGRWGGVGLGASLAKISRTNPGVTSSSSGAERRIHIFEVRR